MAGDADEARKAAKAHLTYVQNIMRDLEREEIRQTVSQKRLERYKSKKS